MGKGRLTIMIEEDAMKFIRNMQSKILTRSEKNISFSSVLNAMLVDSMNNKPSVNKIHFIIKKQKK